MRKKIIFVVVLIPFLHAMPCQAQLLKELFKTALGVGSGIMINNAEKKGTISEETANQARYIAPKSFGTVNVQGGEAWQSANKTEKVNIVDDISHNLQQTTSKENSEIKGQLDLIYIVYIIKLHK